MTEKEDDHILIETNKDIHQDFPWIAAQRTDDIIFQLESHIEKIGNNSWKLLIDKDLDVKKIGLAASNNAGHSYTKILTISKDIQSY